MCTYNDVFIIGRVMFVCYYFCFKTIWGYISHKNFKSRPKKLWYQNASIRHQSNNISCIQILFPIQISITYQYVINIITMLPTWGSLIPLWMLISYAMHSHTYQTITKYTWQDERHVCPHFPTHTTSSIWFLYMKDKILLSSLFVGLWKKQINKEGLNMNLVNWKKCTKCHQSTEEQV